MELLPIIIILSLLGFFILLTLVLFLWQFFRARERRQRKRSGGSEHYKPTRKLTLQSGKAIPTSQKQDTASTRDPYSLDLTTPLPIFTTPTYTVKCEADPKPSKYRPLILAQDHGHPPILADLEAQIPRHDNERPRRVVSEPNRPKEKASPPRVYSVPAKLVDKRTGSLKVPRPALVNIDSRRPSTTRSTERHSQARSQSKGSRPRTRQSSASRGKHITKSLQKAYQDPVLPAQAYELPPNSVFRNASEQFLEGRRTSGAWPSGHEMGSPAVSSRVVSDSIQRPPPLFSGVNYSPRVRFAPPTHIDYAHISFLSMTDSVSSSVTSGQVSPISPHTSFSRAPPPSTVELSHYEDSPPHSDRTSPTRLRNTPPHLETPDFGRISFFDSGKSSPEQSKSLKRGMSVMSNRSNFTIASSEISTTNWTFGNAQVVNIYPSVVQDQERHTPPYATKLRSKYGQYPKGRRNKALPVAPKSPLWQTDFGLV